MIYGPMKNRNSFYFPFLVQDNKAAQSPRANESLTLHVSFLHKEEFYQSIYLDAL